MSTQVSSEQRGILSPSRFFFSPWPPNPSSEVRERERERNACVPFHGTVGVFLFGSLCVSPSLLPSSPSHTGQPRIASSQLNHFLPILSCLRLPFNPPLWNFSLSPKTFSPPLSFSSETLLARCPSSTSVLCHHLRHRQDSAELRPAGLPICHPSPCLSSSGQHTAPSCPGLWRCLRHRPILPAAWRLCVVCGQVPEASTVPSPWTGHTDCSGWGHLPAQRHLPLWLPCADLGTRATGHHLEQGSKKGPHPLMDGWKPRFPPALMKFLVQLEVRCPGAGCLAGAGVCS